MEVDCDNPWQVENITAFNFLCCPECLFRSKEESSFQDHALENHPKSATLFHNDGNTYIKEDPLEDLQYNIKIEPAVEIQTEDQTIENIDIDVKEEELDLHLNAIDSNEIEESEKPTEIPNIFRFPLPKAKGHPCNFCEQIFPERGALKLHVRANHRTPCQDCDMTFDSEFKLRAHVRKVHTTKPKTSQKRTYNCYICEETFDKMPDMSKHVKEHTDKFCAYCGKTFEDTSKLRLHIIERHKRVNNKTCIECDKVFATRSAYTRHRDSIHVEKKDISFKCELCPYTTFFKPYLVQHKRKCPNSEKGAQLIAEKKLAQLKEFPCIKCDEIFISSKAYLTHFRCSHGGEIPPELQDRAKFFCDQCPRAFFTRANLEKHVVKAHTENIQKIYKCTECKEEFKLTAYLEHYRKIHKTIPPDVEVKNIFFCEKCPSFYFTSKGLKKHSQNHDGVKVEIERIQCPECPRTFQGKQYLLEHKRKVHLKITPFECDQCPAKFGTKKYLDKHAWQVHSRVACDICKKEIRNSYELKVHKATSHGIFPPDAFKCDHCPMFFMIQSKLVAHIKSKHF